MVSKEARQARGERQLFGVLKSPNELSGSPK